MSNQMTLKIIPTTTPTTTIIATTMAMSVTVPCPVSFNFCYFSTK